MSTFKTAMRLLRAKKIYILVYLICMGILIMAIMLQPLSTLRENEDEHFQSVRPEVAVVSRDRGGANFVKELSKSLEHSCDLVTVDSSEEGLQKASASNYADLIVIVPAGYVDKLTQAITDGDELPQVETVTSFTGAYGTFAKLKVDTFIQDAATLARAQIQSSGTVDVQAAGKSLDEAFATVARNSKSSTVETIQVSKKSSPDMALRQLYAYTVKIAGYPFFMTIAVCCAVMLRSFQTSEIRKRMYLSPERYSKLNFEEFLACMVFAGAVSVLLFVLSLLMMLTSGMSLVTLGSVQLAACFVSMLVYALMSVAFGFMLCSFGLSETFINGMVNTVGLLIMFTSGQAFSAELMPSVWVMVGKMLPGWWYCTAIDNIYGLGTVTHADWGAWGWNTVLVALFGVAFLCVGLAVSTVRRHHPSVARAATTQLTN